MTSNSRHGLPPRLMAHQPTRFATAQESKPSPSPGIRMRQILAQKGLHQGSEIRKGKRCWLGLIPKPDGAFVQVNAARDTLFADDFIKEPGVEVNLNLLREASGRGALDIDNPETRPHLARIPARPRPNSLQATLNPNRL